MSRMPTALAKCESPLSSHDAPTLAEFGAMRLRAMCAASDFADRETAIVELFDRLVTPWGQRRKCDPPSWPSTVGDDDTPFEFSLGLGVDPEIRVMVEPIARAPSLRANTDEAMKLLSSLAADFDLDLDRLGRIQDLFLPPFPTGTFAIWVAAGFSRSGSAKFKIYLNPFAQGREAAPALVREALDRLGFASAWTGVETILTRRGPSLDELMYLSLDLARSREARVKIYARHRRCTVSDLEDAASASSMYVRGDVTDFLNAVAPDAGGRFDGRAPLTCYAFVEGRGARPISATTHFPINGYATHDRVIRDRVYAYLHRVGLPAESYSRALSRFATRSLESGIGLQSYASFRRDRGQRRLTVYFPVEAYRPGKVASAPSGAPPRRGLDAVPGG
jgi:DMATS type aromatic prenyltransferase